MEWFRIPKEEPSIVFPIGATIEDQKAKYKVLEFEKQGITHKYKCEVLEQKIPIPDSFKPFLDEKIQWVIVSPQNLHNIRRIE